MSDHQEKPLCQHCHKATAHRPRCLCWGCYQHRPTRLLYPAMAAQESGRKGGRAPRAKPPLRGEMVGTAKLTAALVLAARERVARGETRTAVARSLRVTRGAISRAVDGTQWSHVRPG